MDAEVAIEVRNLVEAAVAAVRSSQEGSVIMEQLDEIEALLEGLQPGWGMGASGGGGAAVTGAGCFGLEYDEDSGNTSLVNCYYKRGECLAHASSIEDTVVDSYAGSSRDNPNFLALKCSVTSSSGSATLESYGTFEAMETACEDPDYVIMPLYALYMGKDKEDEEEEESGGSGGSSEGDGEERVQVACDFRTMPRMQVIEDLESSGGSGSGSGSSGS